MILKVVDVKNPILRQKAKPVAKIDKKVLTLIDSMRETLVAQKDPEGVGLAAPQVGKSLQIFLVHYKSFNQVFINPQILEVDKAKKINKEGKRKNKEILEGCLSLPHYYGPIKRSQKVKLAYQNEKGEKITKEFTGFDAQIVQHEVDHLEGRLFVDKILEQKAPLYKFDGDDWEEVEIL